jgi:geranylgeranyl transferase type-2 subunit beta
MEPTSYLLELTARITTGLANLPADERERHAGYVRTAHLTDGGFPGRDGTSDLYYTAFALRSLAVLDALSPEIAARTAEYLRSQMAARTSVVDFFSFLMAVALVETVGGVNVLSDATADWADRVVAELAKFRTPDGGYNKSPGANAGSTYHTFLVGLCFELLERSIPDATELARFALSRRRDDGGFVEVAPMRRSGTNPTAAGIGILELTNPLDDRTRSDSAEFLLGLRSDEGGLCANARIPLADLLSTFTGCWTLHRLGALHRLNAAGLRRYVADLARPDGGFKAGSWDDGHDVEYTFYGLGVLGLIS